MNQAVCRAWSLLANLLDENLGAERFGSLDREAKRARPDQLCKYTQRAGHAEHYRIIVHFLQTIILEKIEDGIVRSTHKVHFVVVNEHQ